FRNEREQYRELYLQTLELCRKLELGILGQKSERLGENDAQLTLALLGTLLGAREAAETTVEEQPVREHKRTKPTGRKPLPLNRLEQIYAREGLELARSTMCGWHAELAPLVRPVVEAMWIDAWRSPYLCTDATGVLVQEKEKCRNGHFWVVVAPERHVLYAY